MFGALILAKHAVGKLFQLREHNHWAYVLSTFVMRSTLYLRGFFAFRFQTVSADVRATNSSPRTRGSERPSSVD
jgi:hypothetical protein